MEEFYIEVQLGIGATQIQVNEIPPEQCRLPGTPQFLIEYFNNAKLVTLTLQLEQGRWYDRNTRFNEDDYYLRYFELGTDEAWNPDCQSPLSLAELEAIGQAIARHMVVYLSRYMSLFVPSFPNPVKN